MKILVTGAAGMLGDALCPTLKNDGHEIIATDINIQDSNVKFLDVRETNKVFDFIERGKYNLVIHLAAETDLEICEADVNHAYMTNTIGTQNVALACQAYNIPMVYTSTAGVFDGKKEEPYTEFDIPNPINIYGKTKFEGEKIVEKLLNKYFIVRAGWMIGGGKKDKKFTLKIIKQINEGARELYVVTDKFGVPTYNVDFSRCLAQLILTNYYGLYHMACKGSGSRYDVAKKILEFLGRTDIKIIPVTSEYFLKEFPAPRPKSEIMRNYMLDLRGMNTMWNWEEALQEYLELKFKK